MNGVEIRGKTSPFQYEHMLVKAAWFRYCDGMFVIHKTGNVTKRLGEDYDELNAKLDGLQEIEWYPVIHDRATYGALMTILFERCPDVLIITRWHKWKLQTKPGTFDKLCPRHHKYLRYDDTLAMLITTTIIQLSDQYPPVVQADNDPIPVYK